MSGLDKMLGLARAQLGIVEGRVNVVKFNDAFYGRRVNGNPYPWCQAMMWWLGVNTGQAGAMPAKTAATQNAAAWYKARGRWGKAPRPGAQVFYDWGHGIAHTGICESGLLPGGYFQAIEGNGLPLDMPVLTPQGWRPIGELAVGDAVVDPGGQPSIVQGVYPQGMRPCWTVKMSDGRSIVADSNHRWAVTTNNGTRKVVTTVEMRDAISQRLTLPRVGIAPDLPGGDDLPLHPWVAGALLGDGATSRGEPLFATTEDWMVARFADLTGVEPRYTGSNTWTLPGMKEVIAAAGLAGRVDYEKVIPDAYLGGSVKHRLALLRGLMDTDGDCDTQGRASFTSSSKRLSEQVLYLVRSLGGTAGFHVKAAPTYAYAPTGEKRTGRPAYRVQNIRLEDNPFTRPRKAARFVPMSQRTMVKGWTVTAVEQAPSQETVCISVSAPSALYIAGDWIVTHNTGPAGASQSNGGMVRRQARSLRALGRTGGFGYPDYSAGAAKVIQAAPMSLASGTARRPDVLPVLRRGATGGWVGLLQKGLGTTIDLSFGPGTEREVKDQQHQYGLVVDGAAGAWVWVSIIADAGASLAMGEAKGHPGVEVLQNYIGLRGGDLDGVLGPQSIGRVMEVQRWAGLEPDGVVGPATRAALTRG